jgi:predicted Zn-dependent protease
MNPDALEKMLAAGQDNALLRFSLGSAYWQQGDAARAVPHLAAAVQHKPDYSAAWKLYAQALAASGDVAAARNAYATGIAVAQQNGDKQAEKEMTVFLRRLDKPTQT